MGETIGKILIKREDIGCLANDESSNVQQLLMAFEKGANRIAIHVVIVRYSLCGDPVIASYVVVRGRLVIYIL